MDKTQRYIDELTNNYGNNDPDFKLALEAASEVMKFLLEIADSVIVCTTVAYCQPNKASAIKQILLPTVKKTILNGLDVIKQCDGISEFNLWTRNFMLDMQDEAQNAIEKLQEGNNAVN